MVIRRVEVRPFSDEQIELLKTFADQTVIAIENTRLLTELQDRLEQQTFTNEILSVISRSQRDVQPVFEVIAANARNLCNANTGLVYTFDGELIHIAAVNSVSPGAVEALHRTFPMPPGRGGAVARSILTRAVVYVRDVRGDPEYGLQDLVQAFGLRSVVSVPMLRDNKPIGAICVTGVEPAMFTQRQVALLQTFADQAVIAIENTRLFDELQERLTATGDILRVISQSQRDVQPVLEAIAASARKLCRSTSGWVHTFDGNLINVAAVEGLRPEGLEVARRMYPMAPNRGGAPARAILSRAVCYIPDIRKDSEYRLQAFAEEAGFLCALAVPMLREGRPIGTVTVAGAEPGMFTERQIAMLQTFADQAVIAIENTRLFNELQARTAELGRSVEELEALGEVGAAVSSTLDVDTVLTTIVTHATQLSGTHSGLIYDYDEGKEELRARATVGLSEDITDALLRDPLLGGEGVTGAAITNRRPVQVADMTADGVYESRIRPLMLQSGFRAVLAVPLIREDQVLGALVVSRKEPGEFSPQVVELLTTFASQSALAIQNARLFHQLEMASKHKSQFLANMSHELRTPLNAILGYTELIQDQIYGEVPEKINEVLDRVQGSGKHLLGLINDVLDLSKIEAGQLVLTLSAYSFSDVIQAVARSVGSLAAEKQLRLTVDVAPDLPVGQGDERRIAQVLLNLVGNSIKFTEKGEVAVRVSASDGAFLVEVADTGPGIRKEDQAKIFEEFQQSDTTVTSSKSGTGLGLSIAKRIVELHGGRIWLESVLGHGSTFFVSLPIKAERRELAA
jgi:signal transduction histidine kinase